MKSNRRKFITKSIAFTLSIGSLKHLHAANLLTEHYHVFVDESNLFSNSTIGNNHLFVIGCLKSSNLTKTKNEFRQIRDRYNYRSELRYRSRDKFKIPFSKNAIDYFFNEPALSFYARVVSGSINENRPDYLAKKKASYQLQYKKAIADSLKGKKGTVYLETRSLYGKDRALIKILEDRFLLPVESIESSSNDLIQISDLFTGSIYGDKADVENETKLELLKYIKEKLEVEQFSDLYNETKNDKFQISFSQI